jgi:hypothetical protein
MVGIALGMLVALFLLFRDQQQGKTKAAKRVPAFKLETQGISAQRGGADDCVTELAGSPAI